MDRTPLPYDEMYSADGHVRPHYAAYADGLIRQPDDTLRQKRAEADSLFHRVGITFAVYGEQDGNERLIPFDIVPRVLAAKLAAQDPRTASLHNCPNMFEAARCIGEALREAFSELPNPASLGVR